MDGGDSAGTAELDDSTDCSFQSREVLREVIADVLEKHRVQWLKAANFVDYFIARLTHCIGKSLFKGSKMSLDLLCNSPRLFFHENRPVRHQLEFTLIKIEAVRFSSETLTQDIALSVESQMRTHAIEWRLRIH